ncbi:MAG: T9SS type A sorting domain-containing protein [Saprospiraceae bacterium]
MKKELLNQLDSYQQISKGVGQSLKPLAKGAVALGATFMAGIPVTEGAVVYSGLQNVAVNAGAGYTAIDIDGGGDPEISLRCDNNPNFFAKMAGNFVSGQGFTSGGSFYFNKHNSTVNINAALGGFVATNSASFSWQGGPPWGGMSSGSQGYIAFKLTGNRYGWLRLQKGSGNNWIAVDWAYESAANTTITPASSLPVELISFSATPKATSVQLGWTTASEADNAGFEVQRSLDGKNFEVLDFIAGAGNTTSVKDYYYDDKALREGQTYYYRLKQIDYDGQFELSSVVTAVIEANKPQTSEFYPNPTSGHTKIDYTATQNETLAVSIYDVNGRELFATERAVVRGINTLDFDLSALPAGSYFVKLAAGENALYQKLTIN